MEEIETGGPAFPAERNLTQGMTLRDYFAAKAMQVELSNNAATEEEWREYIAKLCYQMADAMLKARKEKQ